jgi:trk system potassium uptake protein
MLVVIVGCGRVGAELAKLLSNEGHDVVVVDKFQKSFDRLGSSFNGVTMVGNGFDIELLKQVGIEKADAFCAVTNGDNSNLIAAQVAKKLFGVARVFARVYDPRRAHIYKTLGLDIISGTMLFASMLRDKIVESRFSSYLIEAKDLGVLEIEAKPPFVGKSIAEFNMPQELLVVAIRRMDGVIIPEPGTVIGEKDVLMAVVKVASLGKIKHLLQL